MIIMITIDFPCYVAYGGEEVVEDALEEVRSDDP